MATELYTLQPSLGKGLGCFAITTISPGALLLVETPLFSVLEPRSNVGVVAAFHQLASSDQEEYLKLHALDPTSDGSTRIIDIFDSNAWQTGPRTSILPKAARFNHSCIPNATLSYSSKLNCITVRSLVVIEIGDEIHLSYIPPYLNLSSRKLKLSLYGFVCYCGACGSHCVASESRRRKMIALDAKIRVARRQKWKKEVPNSAIALVRLLKEEGLIGEALGLAYHDVMMGWEKMERLDLALRYALMELNAVVLCFGDDSPNADSTRDHILRLEQGLSEKKELLLKQDLVVIIDNL